MESNFIKALEREATDIKYNSIQLRKELRSVHAELQQHREGEARERLLARFWSIHDRLEADTDYGHALAQVATAMRNRLEVMANS